MLLLSKLLDKGVLFYSDNRLSPIHGIFDPLRNATKELQGYQDDDYEFAAGLWQGRPVVYMHRAAAALYDSVDKQLGVVPAVKSAIRVENGRTVYELAFPRLLVSPFRLQAGSAMRFSVLVNVNNGKGRAGWLELTPGIGQTPKLPGNFIDLILLPEMSQGHLRGAQ